MIVALPDSHAAYTCDEHPHLYLLGKPVALAHLLAHHPEVVAHPATPTDAGLAWSHVTSTPNAADTFGSIDPATYQGAPQT